MEHAPPAVHCTSCEREWHSEAMAEGLRLIGSCPRCGGDLCFDAPAPAMAHADSVEMIAADADGRPAHMILGMPRGW